MTTLNVDDMNCSFWPLVLLFYQHVLEVVATDRLNATQPLSRWVPIVYLFAQTLKNVFYFQLQFVYYAEEISMPHIFLLCHLFWLSAIFAVVNCHLIKKKKKKIPMDEIRMLWMMSLHMVLTELSQSIYKLINSSHSFMDINRDIFHHFSLSDNQFEQFLNRALRFSHWCV